MSTPRPQSANANGAISRDELRALYAKEYAAQRDADIIGVESEADLALSTWRALSARGYGYALEALSAHAATLAVALPTPVSPDSVKSIGSLKSIESNIVSRISEVKHQHNTNTIPTSTPTPAPTKRWLPSAEQILAVMLNSVHKSQLACAQITAQKRTGKMRFQDMVEEWTPEERLVHRAFKSRAKAKGFRIIWGIARRHAEVGNAWFPIKESYLRQSLKYKNRASIHDLIEDLCSNDLAVLVPHPSNGHGLDCNLYRWALPTNIWKIADDDPCPF